VLRAKAVKPRPLGRGYGEPTRAVKPLIFRRFGGLPFFLAVAKRTSSLSNSVVSTAARRIKLRSAVDVFSSPPRSAT
jgi:hypothetical protein